MSKAESAGERTTTTSRRVRDEESLVATLNSTPGVVDWQIDRPIEGVFRAVVEDESALERLMDARPATVYPLRIRRESGEVVLQHRDAMASFPPAPRD